MPESAIPPETIAAYLKTDYRVAADPPFVMRVGQACAALDGLYACHGVDCCAFISACNRLGELSDAAINAGRQAEFKALLERRSLRHLTGAGVDPDGAWPPEASFLVLGLTLDDARDIGQALRQNAVICCGADRVPQLVLLR